MPISFYRFGTTRWLGVVSFGQTISKGIVHRFGGDRCGTVSTLWAFAVVPLVALIGLAVDFGSAYSARAKTQSALDAAALAAARVAQVEQTDRLNKASAAATTYFNQAKPTSVLTTAFTFSANSELTQFTVAATSWMRTPFLGALRATFGGQAIAGAPSGCREFGCVKLVTTATSEITLGGTQPSNVEIALMLDVTGSMAGGKLLDLKSAARDLVDIVILDNQSQFTARVALAPFADAVRPGRLYLLKVRGLRAAINRFRDNHGRWQTYKLSECVSERGGQAAYTDGPPVGNDKVGPVYTKSGMCTPDAAIVPLTSDKILLKLTIDALTAGGYTAGHLGTAWAWYLISPNWAGIWPAGSTPAAYGDKTVRKIAILMTDGEYNQQYDASGIATRENGQGAMNGLSDAQARRVCDNMKGTGIEVFAVGFDLRERKAIETLHRCATDPEHFYLAENGDQLRQVYRDIALKISTLRLTN